MPASAELKAVLDGAVAVSNLGSKVWCGQTYKDVFTGEILISVLQKEPTNYPSRETAIVYAQELLDTRIITCITKRRAFDHGDRLYCVNHKTLENTESFPTTNVARKNPSVKITANAERKETASKQNSQEVCVNHKSLENAENSLTTNVARKNPSVKIANAERKETVSKQNSLEKINFRSLQDDKRSFGKAPSLSEDEQGSLRGSSNLLRLLEKDAAQRSPRRSLSPGTKLASPDVKNGQNVVLKDKQPESHKDKTLVSNRINTVLHRKENLKEKPQGQETGSTYISGKSISASLGETPPAGKAKPDGHSMVSDNKTGNDKKGSLHGADTVISAKHFESDDTAVKGKQKLEKKLSPALTALIEKDSKNNHPYRKKEQTEGKKPQRNNEEASTGENEDLSNSWDAFQLKLQSKVKKSTQGQSLGGREGTSNNCHAESGRVVFGGVNARDELEKSKLENKLSTEKHEPTSKDDFPKPKEKLNLHKLSHDVVMPSIAARQNSFLSLEQSKKETKEDTNERNSTPVSKDEHSKDTLNMQGKLIVNDDEMLIPSVRARTNSFLGLEQAGKTKGDHFNPGKTDQTGRERTPSFSLNDSETIIIEDAAKDSSADKTKGFKPKESVPSFSLNDYSKLLIEDTGAVKIPFHNKEHTFGKEPPGTKERTSSFSKRSESTTVLTVKGNVKRTLSQELYIDKEVSVTGQRKSSFGDTKTTIGDTSLQDMNQDREEIKHVDGHAIPKRLAALLARDGSSLEKKDQALENDETNVFRDKLKGLKKAGPRPTSVPAVVTSSKPKGQSSAKNDSLLEHLDGQDVLDKTTSSKDQKETTSPMKVPPNQLAFRSTSVEENLTSSVKAVEGSKVFTVEQPSHGNVKQESSRSLPIVHLPNQDNASSTSCLESPEHPSTKYVVPLLNLCPSNSYNSENASTVSPNTSLLTRPSSLNISCTLRPSPLASHDASPLQLREELDRSREDFEESKQKYENKITELQLQIDFLRRQKSGQIDSNENDPLESSASFSDFTSLYSSFSTPVVSPGNSNVTSPSPTPNATPRGSVLEEYISFSPRSPPPPPPAPPSLPAVPIMNGSHVKPTKAIVNPRTDMKPLFWNRIIASKDSDRKGKCVWKTIKEPVIDTTEFERLFSKKSTNRKFKRTKSLRDDKHFTRINGKKVAKLLETNRSRAIGIKMSSLNCQLEDIRNAVYNMDTSAVDMESLQSIYDIYPKEGEVQLIEEHFKKLPSVPLDKPEEFMYQLTKMKHFKERLECWLFQDKFSEIVYGIERSLACVIESCNVICTNAEISAILALVLAYGNYMNGNTMRGQADGFHLDVLLKLRDVKTKDSDMNLLQYTVKQYLKKHDRSTDKNKNESRLPSSVSLFNAAQVSFDKLKEELLKVSLLLKETELQVKKILDECLPTQRNPFEEQMRKFQTTAKQKILEENKNMEKAEVAFRETVEYFEYDTDGKKETAKEFFSLWAKFIEDIKNCVKLEKQQQQLAKKNFSKIEHLNQIREAATRFKKRRQSVDIL